MKCAPCKPGDLPQRCDKLLVLLPRVGNRASINLNERSPCPVNEFQDELESDSCKVCPIGFFTAERTGAAACVKILVCDAGETVFVTDRCKPCARQQAGAEGEVALPRMYCPS